MPITREKAPEPKGAITFQLPEIKNITLDNGLKVMFVQKDNLPIVQINAVVSAGSKFDTPGKEGVAYLTSGMIDEGAGDYDALQLDDEIEKLGSVLSTSVDQDTSLISMMCIKENVERSMELLSLVITKPSFNQSDFDREKEKLLTKIIQLKDEPTYIANSAFEKLLFDETPYAMQTIGVEKTASNIFNDDVKSFYKEHFTIDNTYLVIVGNLTEHELKNMLGKYFVSWNSKGTTEEPIIIEKRKPNRIYIVHRDNSPQSEIRIGHLAKGRNTEDFFAKSIMNSILGGQFSSRINLNLREDKGFTYGANSSFSYKKGINCFVVSTAVQNENCGAAVSEILKELKSIKEKIKEDELEFAKSNQIKSFPLIFETYSQVARNLTHLIIHSLPGDYFNKYIDNLSKQTLTDVNNAAKENIDNDHLLIVVIGDKNVIRQKLKDATGLEPVELNVEGELI